MKNRHDKIHDKPIDAVIAWVDGDDPLLKEKRNRYLDASKGSSLASGAHSTRFASNNEIRYCVMSIMKFAPFVRNIYLITDGQDPGLYNDIKTYFPERINSFRIVDHREIFESYEQYLPTFNSISIGHMIWRIKGLSDSFVYFNDDTFLVREIKPRDWFNENKPVIRGKWIPAPRPRVLWNNIRIAYKHKILGRKNYKPRASFHLGQWQSAALLGFKTRYFTTSHTPHAVEKSVIERYFKDNTESYLENISFRFRNYKQFTFISLSNHLQLKSGNRNIAKPDVVYLQPFNRGKSYIDKKLKVCEQKENIRYLCVQSLDLCDKKEQDKVLDWMGSLIGVD